MELNTKYGILKDAGYPIYYPDGNLKECVLKSKNILEIDLGKFIPKYTDDNLRRKLTNSLEFYEDGNLKKIALDMQTTVDTFYGKIEAELITFYESGKLKRIFPLNGRLSGYWSEEDEANLAKEMEFKIGENKINAKISAINLYESRVLKSLTFFPKENFKLKTSIGEISGKKGISFYENGKVKSIEPLIPIDVNTEIGIIRVYNPTPYNIIGDRNTLEFYEDGRIKSLASVFYQFEVIDKETKEIEIIKPDSQVSMCNDKIRVLVPLFVKFHEKTIVIKGKEFNKDKYDFLVKDYKNEKEKLSFSCTDVLE